MVHAYFLSGWYILLDVNSSLVHVVDECVYRLIKLINKDMEAGNVPASCVDFGNIVEQLSGEFPREDLEEAAAEIKELIEKKALYTEDIYKNIAPQIASADTNLKAMCLHIAHGCNLKCRYCFAGEGEYREKGLMSFEVGKKAIDYLIASSGKRRNLEVDFFGGEPLLNFEVVRQIVEYARGLEEKYNKNFRFTLTTNALLLNVEITDFLNREMSNVVLSLDGRKEINDRMRMKKDGSGSFEEIVPNIKRFVERRGDKDYYIRGTFTRENLDFTADIQQFLDLGFKNLSMEPVVTTADYGIRKEDLPKIMDEYEKLAQLYINKKKAGEGFTFFHFMIDLDGGPCAVKLLKGCGSGTEYVAVTPYGEIYPCHQFVGQEGFQIGDVDNGITNFDLVKKFKEANLYTKDKCEKCFAKFFCSGGCPANSWNFSRDINKTYEIGCEMQRKRVECAIMIKAALAD